MWRRALQAAVLAVGKLWARPLPAQEPAGHPAVPGSTAPAFPPAAGGGSAAPGAADAPTAARLLGVERRMEDGLTIPLAAGAPLEAMGGTAGPGTAPRISAEHMAAAGTLTTAPASKTPPSRQTPGRKIRPRRPPSRNIPAALRQTLPGAAGGPSRPGKAPCPLEPGIPTAMCRHPARPARLRLVQRGQAVPSGPVRPIPARQEWRLKPLRRSNPTTLSPVRQERKRTPSPPDPPIPQAAAR